MTDINLDQDDKATQEMLEMMGEIPSDDFDGADLDELLNAINDATDMESETSLDSNQAPTNEGDAMTDIDQLDDIEALMAAMENDSEMSSIDTDITESPKDEDALDTDDFDLDGIEDLNLDDLDMDLDSLEVNDEVIPTEADEALSENSAVDSTEDIDAMLAEMNLVTDNESELEASVPEHTQDNAKQPLEDSDDLEDIDAMLADIDITANNAPESPNEQEESSEPDLDIIESIADEPDLDLLENELEALESETASEPAAIAETELGLDRDELSHQPEVDTPTEQNAPPVNVEDELQERNLTLEDDTATDIESLLDESLLADLPELSQNEQPSPPTSSAESLPEKELNQDEDNKVALTSKENIVDPLTESDELEDTQAQKEPQATYSESNAQVVTNASQSIESMEEAIGIEQEIQAIASEVTQTAHEATLLALATTQQAHASAERTQQAIESTFLAAERAFEAAKNAGYSLDLQAIESGLSNEEITQQLSDIKDKNKQLKAVNLSIKARIAEMKTE